MRYIKWGGESYSLVCTYFVSLLLGLEIEGWGWVREELYPGSLQCETPSQAQRFSRLFPSLQNPSPWIVGRAHMWTCRGPSSTAAHVVNHFPTSWHQCHPYVTLQPLQSSRLANSFPALQPQLPSRQCWKGKYVAKQLHHILTPISGVWPLSARPICSPCTGTRFPYVVPGISVRVLTQMIFVCVLIIGSYYIYCLATCSF